MGIHFIGSMYVFRLCFWCTYSMWYLIFVLSVQLTLWRVAIYNALFQSHIWHLLCKVFELLFLMHLFNVMLGFFRDIDPIFGRYFWFIYSNLIFFKSIQSTLVCDCYVCNYLMPRLSFLMPDLLIRLII